MLITSFVIDRQVLLQRAVILWDNICSCVICSSSLVSTSEPWQTDKQTKKITKKPRRAEAIVQLHSRPSYTLNLCLLCDTSACWRDFFVFICDVFVRWWALAAGLGWKGQGGGDVDARQVRVGEPAVTAQLQLRRWWCSPQHSFVRFALGKKKFF